MAGRLSRSKVMGGKEGGMGSEEVRMEARRG